MGDIVGRVAAIIFGCFILFVAPIVVIAQKQDAVTQNYIDNAIVEFVDNARSTGRISPFAYESFCRKVDAAGVIFEIDIMHSATYIDWSKIDSYDPLDPDDIAAHPDAIEEPMGSGTYYELTKLKNVSIKQDILNIMYPVGGPNKDYLMKNGDYLRVEVKNITPTLGRRLVNAVFRSYGDTSIYSTYGGLVGNNVQ